MINELRSLSGQFEHWLLDIALPLWWETGADHKQGGYHEAINQDGTPSIVPRRARVQGRQSYVFATAGALRWDGPWESASDHGLIYLNDRYLTKDGLFCTLVSAEGAVLDPTAKTYDQSFALLAMAWLYRANPKRSHIPDSALRLLKRIVALRRYSLGGFVEAADRPFQSNPNMHLLEASLAWCEVAPNAEWWTVADDIATLSLTRFIGRDGSYLREYFDDSWAPFPGANGRIVEPGHQFEWAWLLARWGRMRSDSAAQKIASKLFASGTRGVSTDSAFAIDEMDDAFRVTRASARLWPQTERLKAALILSQSCSGSAADQYLDEASTAANALLAYLRTPRPGLWWDKRLPSGEFVAEAAPASSFYHIVCAIVSLLDAMERPSTGPQRRW